MSAGLFSLSLSGCRNPNTFSQRTACGSNALTTWVACKVANDCGCPVHLRNHGSPERAETTDPFPGGFCPLVPFKRERQSRCESQDKCGGNGHQIMVKGSLARTGQARGFLEPAMCHNDLLQISGRMIRNSGDHASFLMACYGTMPWSCHHRRDQPQSY